MVEYIKVYVHVYYIETDVLEFVFLENGVKLGWKRKDEN